MTAQANYHNPPPIHPKIAGDQFMMTERTKRCFGKPGFIIWQKCIHNRDFKGELKDHVTNAGIAKVTGYSVSTVEKYMRRLRSVGVVVDTTKGYHVVRPDRDGRPTKYTVKKRRVYGDWREGQIHFPKRVHDAICKLAGHGGPRKGAGRKPASEIKSKVEMNSRVGSKDRRENRALSSKEDKGGQGHVSNPSFIPSKRSDKVVPPYPASNLFHLPKIPDPPLIPDDASDEEAVRMCIRAYWGATESYYGKKVMVLAKGELKKSKHYEPLLAAANTLRELGYSPGAWAMFCMDYWKTYLEENVGKKKGSKNKPPPLRFVFNEKFIYDKRGHFRKDSLNYTGGTLVFPQYFREVHRRYTGMQWDFRIKQPKTLLEVGRIIEHWFPNGWQYHYRIVREQAASDKARLQRMLNRGEWLW